ncbi:hypothetical protein HGRIS_012862 [Hohenbuehelia grisea]|uniref:Gaa1-domain-containing protein n=1 Tax=Hohenbuehelia grisea TaxID=104357 RepID=A0ABR3ITR4_9AGAR
MERLRRLIRRPTTDPNVARLQRRAALVRFIYNHIWIVRTLLFIGGYVWMLAIPSPELGRGTYIDENALQPAQVNTYWSWGEVHSADKYLAKLEELRDQNASSAARAEFIATEFMQLGIAAATQKYEFTLSDGSSAGANAYAISPSPRTAGNEAMVISASWLSRTGDGDGTLNLRGVATVLALADFFKQYSLWAKDIIYVISDGYMEGMQAWLSAYHETTQTNLRMESLAISSGTIWTAINIDYPGHSFSHLGIFHEGLNGRLPNQDLINSFEHISKYTGGVPVLLYDHGEPGDINALRSDFPWLPNWLQEAIHDQIHLKTYFYRAKNILRHVSCQARGRASGVHGLFHQFRIDAFTVFALPAQGPHGFHALGRIVESFFRTTNNLLERLHASFFFYIFASSTHFLKVGSFLPSAVLISVAMMFGGLKHWTDAAWHLDHLVAVADHKDGSSVGNTNQEKWIRRRRPVLNALGIMISTHALGSLLFLLATSSWWQMNNQQTFYLLFPVVLASPLIALTVRPTPPSVAPLATLLKALNLCFASTVISTTTVLNFSLAAVLAVLLGIPLSIASPSRSLPIKIGKYSCYVIAAFGWMVLTPAETSNAFWNWDILGVWFAPFVCLVYAPLMLQAGIVCLLPS